MFFGRNKNQADRDAAIAMVREAAAEGRISSLDRDHRVEALANANSADEIEVYVRDLRLPIDPHTAGAAVVESARDQAVIPPTAASGAAIPSAAGFPPPPAGISTYGAPGQPVAGVPPQVWVQQGRAQQVGTLTGQPQLTKIRPKRGMLVLLVFLLVTLGAPVVGGIAVFRTVGGSGQSTGTAVVHGHPGLLAPDGLDGLIAAVEKQTGGAEVFRAVVRDDFAMIDLPVDATTSRYRTYRWDGDLVEVPASGTANVGRVDLTKVNARAFEKLLARVSRGVTDINDRWIVVQGKDALGPPSLMAYVVTEFNESSLLCATLSGKIIG